MSSTLPARLARWIVAAELPIILAIAPALLFPTPRRLAVLTVVPIIWLCAPVTGNRLVPRTPFNAALWLLLVMVGVSLLATFDVEFSLGKVAGVLLGVLLFWAIVRWQSTAGRLAAGTAAFLVAGGALAVIGLLGTPPQGKFPALAIIPRLPMLIRNIPGAEEGFNNNVVAGCLALFVPLQVVLLRAATRRLAFPDARILWASRWVVPLQACLLMLTASTVLLMQSRSAWVGLAAGASAFLLWHSKRTRMFIALVIVVAIVMAGALGPIRLAEIGEQETGVALSYASIRVTLWSRAMAAIQDFPMTGIGMNAFRRLGPDRYGAVLISPYTDIAHAHNNLLQTALDVGIPGLIAYLAIWILAGVLLANVYRRAHEPIYRVMAEGLAVGLIAHFVFGLADAIPLGAKVGVLFWLTLALTAALHQVAMASPETSPQRMGANS